MAVDMYRSIRVTITISGEEKNHLSPVVRLNVLDSLAVVLEDVDPHHGPIKSGVRALNHLVVEVLTAGKQASRQKM